MKLLLALASILIAGPGTAADGHPRLRTPNDFDEDEAYVARKRDGDGPDPGENEAHRSHYDGDYNHGSHHGGYSDGRGGHGHGHRENYHDNPGWQHRDQGRNGHHGSNNNEGRRQYQPHYSPRYHNRHGQNRGGGEVCSQPPNIQDLNAASVVATGVLTLQAGGNININENNCRETKHIHSRNPHAHFQCPCDHGCNGFTTLMETQLQGDTCVGNYNTQGVVNLNSPCGGGGNYIRHMQVVGDGSLNVINKSGSHSVLNVERDINIDTLTCDTLVIVDWSY